MGKSFRTLHIETKIPTKGDITEMRILWWSRRTGACKPQRLGSIMDLRWNTKYLIVGGSSFMDRDCESRPSCSQLDEVSNASHDRYCKTDHSNFTVGNTL